MVLAVIGTGYVGLVAGVGFADAGHQVWCVDKDSEKIKALQNGQIPIYEPGLEDLLARNRARLQFTTDIKAAVEAAQVLFVAVGTPEQADGSADTRPVFEVVRSICQLADKSKIIVLKSTVPIGTARKVHALAKEHSRFPMEIVNNPEFLREGAAIDDFLSPDRVVIGCSSDNAKHVMTELYRPFTLQQDRPLIFMDNTSAEMTKYAANAFLSVKISFINELALLADKTGADINSVRTGFTSDHRINPAFFHPGVGYGGSCFPKDVKELIFTAQNHQIPMAIVEAADQVNDRQKLVLFERAKAYFNGDLRGKKIAIWGLSFKPSTDDVREAPALYLIRELVAAGAHVVAYDPIAGPNAKKSFGTDFELAENPLDCVRQADALLVVTEWNEFKNPDLTTLKNHLKRPLIFDGRNIFDPELMREQGFEYFCIGRQMLSQGERI